MRANAPLSIRWILVLSRAVRICFVFSRVNGWSAAPVKFRGTRSKVIRRREVRIFM